MAEIQCFILQETNRCRQYLRRYHADNPWHDARVRIEDSTVIVSPDMTYQATTPMDKTDSRYPTRCTEHPDCDYVFSDSDVRQLMIERIYVDDSGNEYILKDLPPGAMYYADWLPWKGTDGHCLSLQTPGGPWNIDQHSSQGTPWERTGIPPLVTANPSVHIIGKYHGWLRNGYLIDV